MINLNFMVISIAHVFHSLQQPTHPEPVGLSHKLIDKWEISKSSIVLKERIGQGQFGEVYKAVWNKTAIVAVKTLKPSKLFG